MDYNTWFRKKWYIVFICLAIPAGLAQLFFTGSIIQILAPGLGILISYGIYKVQYPDE